MLPKLLSSIGPDARQYMPLARSRQSERSQKARQHLRSPQVQETYYPTPSSSHQCMTAQCCFGRPRIAIPSRIFPASVVTAGMASWSTWRPSSLFARSTWTNVCRLHANGWFMHLSSTRSAFRLVTSLCVSMIPETKVRIGQHYGAVVSNASRHSWYRLCSSLFRSSNLRCETSRC
jgi:hypothetical protein